MESMKRTPTSALKNIMAYYMPDKMRAQLYPTISPVNSFRLVFDGLGYADLPLLKDYSFFSPEPGKYPFEVIPNNCPGNE